MTRKVSFAVLCAVVFAVAAPALFAQDGASGQAASGPADNNMFIAIAIGWGLGLAVLGGAMGQGRAIAASVEAMARQPEAGGRIFGAMIIGLALIETLVIYIWVTTFILMGNMVELPIPKPA